MSQTHKLHSLVEIPEGKQSKSVSESAASLYTSALLERQAHWESNARTYPRRIPIAIRSAQGIYVKDVEGRKYIDCLAGAGALALGHSHPVVVEVIQRALTEGVPFQTLGSHHSDQGPIHPRFVWESAGGVCQSG